MRRVDQNPELLTMAALLNLQSGDLVLDAQTEPDLMLRFIHDRTGSFGRALGMAIGRETFSKSEAQAEKWSLRGIEVELGHPATHLQNFDNDFFHAVVMRNTQGLMNLERPLTQVERILKPGGRIVARHTQWDVQLPKATEKELEMIQTLAPRSAADGNDFFRRFETVAPKGWREVRYDVYTVATRDPRGYARHDYDWRTMLRDQLNRTRSFTPRETLDLIERLEGTRGAKVSIDRYLALGIKR